MATIKKNATYYIGRPVKKGKYLYEMKTAYVDKNGKIHYQVQRASKARDFTGGFMGWGVTERAICISQSAFDKLIK
jgi:hypothetical protein